MQKVNNLWKLETTPSIVLYTGNYPSIPVSYLQIINNTPYSNLSNCSFYQNNPSTTSVSCSLSDTVIYQNDNLLVPINNIPFGFIHSGTQPFVSLGLIKQNGQWLINSDQNF